MANISDLTTFGVSATTKHLHRITDLESLSNCDYDLERWFILGGGSNVLFVEQAPEHILLVENTGIEYRDDGEHVEVTVQAGVNWHNLVSETLDKGHSGLENLALMVLGVVAIITGRRLRK